MEAQRMSIAEFLTARLDEEEAVACAAIDAPTASGPEVQGVFVELANLAAKHVLADIAAKRAIVERVAEEHAGWNPPQSNALGDDMLRLLASLYASHKDYDPAWRVG